MVLKGLHRGHAAAILKLPPGERVGPSAYAQAVLLLFLHSYHGTVTLGLCHCCLITHHIAQVTETSPETQTRGPCLQRPITDATSILMPEDPGTTVIPCVSGPRTQLYSTECQHTRPSAKRDPHGQRKKEIESFNSRLDQTESANLKTDLLLLTSQRI